MILHYAFSMNWFLGIIITLIGSWILIRLFTWLISWLLWRLMNIHLKVGSIGVLTLGRVYIKLGEKFTLEIEKIWLSSSYVNHEIKKPLCVCLGDVRLQVILKDKEDQKNAASDNKETSRVNKTIPKLLSLLQFTSIQSETIHIIVMKDSLQDSMINFILNEVKLDWSLQQTSLNISASVHQFTSKVLRKQLQESDVQPCLAELSLQLELSVLLDVTDIIPPEIVKLKIPHVQAMVTEAMVLHIQKMRKANNKNALTITPVPVQSQRAPPKILTLLPKEASVEIENVSVVLIRETAKRTLSATIRQTTVHLLQGANFLNNSHCHILLEDFQAKSPQANISNLNRFTFSLDISENNVTIDTKVISSFLGYHHEEIHYWLGVFTRLRDERGLKPKPSLQSTSNDSKWMSGLREKTVSLTCNIQESSMAVAMVTCSGVKGGLAEAKVNVTVMPAHNGGSPDIRAELEVTALYCKLADGGAHSADLSSKIHHWNTLCYVGIAICKANTLGNGLFIESMVDCVQLESSTSICSVIGQLLVVIQKTKLIPSPVAEPIKANQEGSGDADTHEYLNGGRTTKTRGRLKEIVEDAVFNLKVTSVNIFATNDLNACVMLRLDSLKVDHKDSSADVDVSGTKLVYFLRFDRTHNIQRSVDMQHYNGHMKSANIVVNMKSKSVISEISEELSFRWTTAFHMAAYQAVQDVTEVCNKLQVNKSPRVKPKQSSSQTAVSVSVTVQANTFIIIQLSQGYKLTVGCPSMTLTSQAGQLGCKVDELVITFDQHDVIKVQGLHVYSQHHSPLMTLTRQSSGTLDLPTNRCFVIAFQALNIVFPHKYDFAACLEQVINLNKWRKLVHKKKKKPFTIDSPLPPDIVINAKNVQVQWNDDPMEVKLWDNYELMVDEYHESEKRRQAMDKRIAELRKQYGLLPDGKIQELYNQLSKKSGEVYMQRTRQLYATSQCRTKLYTWRMEALDITALADTSFHGKDNVLKHMMDIDPDSPFPEDNMEFSSLFCRYITLDLSTLTVQLKDFPQPMLDINNMHVWGRFIGAEQEAPERAKRACKVDVAHPWGDVIVYRSMPPLKFFHDFSSDISSWTHAYGSVWEPTFAEFNLAMNLINKPSLDPSVPLPFWDKLRLLLHGRLTMSVDKMSWLYHASINPYNTTELWDWTWTNLVLDWTNAKWVLKGDLDISSKTASKYDDCRLLRLPNLRFCVRLDWVCLGDPNDHHSVMPCAPDKVPEYSVQEHDSYRSFRSQCLNLNMSLETKPGSSTDVPTCLFYSNTLKWMDKVRNCMDRVSRPIRRGKLFENLVPRKPILSRHYRDIHLSVNFHQFEVYYWVSFAKQHGMEMRGDAFQLSIGPQLTLVPVEDGLYHRDQAKWTIQHFKSELNDATIWLCSSRQPDSTEEPVPLVPTVNKSFLINVHKVLYQRHEPGDSDFTEAADLKENDNEREKPVHKLQVYNLKGSFTASNRNVAIILYDGYQNAATLRKNLSSEALKGFKVDKTQTPNSKLRSHSLSAGVAATQTPSPMSRIQSGHAFAMLKKLVTESDSKFVAVHEEVSGADVHVEQLHGVAACQTDDVIKKKWHIEVYNSQLMLKGCETPGYVIISAAKTSILNCEHQPVWKDRALKTKATWVGSIDCMQYYGTINAPENLEASQDSIMWVSQENIEDRSDLPTIAGITEMVGTGQSVGGIITSTMGATAEVADDKQIQLQRIISRCKCQVFYAGYGEADPNEVASLPARPSDQADMMKRQEGVDAFTLLHHNLNISSNSKQYSIIMDIVNNLVLYVEPKKKDLNERLQGMRFRQQLSSKEDQKTPILVKQNKIRELVSQMRKVERELYLVIKALEEDEDDESRLVDERWRREKQVNQYKTDLNIWSEELNIMISVYKEGQLQAKAQIKAAKAHQAAVVKINEVCFKHAEWRFTDVDGQLGKADLVLRNFLYSKVNKDDDSGSHLLELGWAKVTNLLPNTIYREVVAPQGLSTSEKQMLLRILCKFRAPVGGIPIKEHLEINVSPVTLQLTHQFYKTLMAFFFPEKDEQDTTGADRDADTSSMSGSRLDLSSGSTMKGSGSTTKKKGSSRSKESRSLTTGDIDKMKDRAAKNNTFIYVKVPEVPLKFSYKGMKDKNIADLHEVTLILPMMEYHNKTWTWLDLMMAMKNDSKKDVIAQAIKQKLHVKSRMPLEMVMSVVHQEEDKAKMLLGAKLMNANTLEKSNSSKKSLFGKSGKKGYES